MTKKEMIDILKKLEGYQITFEHNIQDNGMTEEEIIRTLVESIEGILFSAVKCQEIINPDVLIPVCIITLHEIGIVNCGYETNTGKAESLNISEMYKDLMRFDEDS